MARKKRNPKKVALAQAILDGYNPSSVEDMNDALKDIFGPLFEAMLQDEMENHLGYDSNNKGPKKNENRRNGYGNKTLKTSNGEIILDSLHFDNNDKGFNSLLSYLSKLNEKDDVFIGFESTSHYHQTLFNFLTSKKYKCYLINPYMTSKFRSISLRDAKNDNIDSKAIAKFLSFEYRNLLNEEFQNNELKELSTQRQFLITESSKLKIKLKSYLDRVFPELESIVNINTAAIRAILKEYPTAKSISSVRIDKLKNIAKEASKGKYSIAKVEALKETAKTSIGIDSSSIGLNIIQCIETLELKERQIDIIEKEIKKHPTVLNSFTSVNRN